jgi:hypothetical protein
LKISTNRTQLTSRSGLQATGQRKNAVFGEARGKQDTPGETRGESGFEPGLSGWLRDSGKTLDERQTPRREEKDGES